MSLLIVNIVLPLLGSETTQDIESNEWAKVINATVNTRYLSILKRNKWNFAKKIIKLNQLSSNDNPKFRFAFNLPSNFVREVNVYFNEDYKSPVYDYQIIRGTLYGDSKTVYIEYIQSNVNVDTTDENFKLALAYDIIINIPQLYNDKTMLQYYIQRARDTYNEAVAIDNSNIGMLPKMNQARKYL